MRSSVSLCLVLGALGLASRPARAQSGLNSKDLEDISHGRPTSTQNLNQANTADERALTAEAAHVAHYYNPDWVPGALLPIKGEPQAAPGLRYNLVHHWVEAQDATVPGGVRLYLVGSLRGFVLNNAPGQAGHRFGAYRVGGAGRLLLEELTEGPVRLLLGYDLELVGAVRNAAIGVETQAAQFRRTSELYVATPARAQAQKMALSQRAVLRLFGAAEGDMALYAQQHNLHYDNLTEVVRLVDHFNSSLTPGP
ncbi:hypothetical protein [Hymenobacter coccineus]|uniref:Uncharacterized protein n=1 Tax=Hymenobacter coccineus TaxID=1908235 RepID=A0A1G1TMB5_9BACT|nr:hypothetical protein [Hymenobacter coccineus]OGX92014.1 hypothetical protein BEN49_17640 [Hymenobacter coccineus]